MEQNISLQEYFKIIAAERYIKYFNGTARTDSWKTNGMPEDNIENIAKSQLILHQLLSIFIY